MLSYVSSYFEPVSSSQQYRRGHRLALIVIVAVGTWLRFWQLGDVGLHGDEDIMALAARGIVEHGVPLLPSEILYLRAPLHTYLLAGSTVIFGDTEWALRLPSAIVGSASILLAFFLGRRFLDPKYNLLFVAMVAFLPAMLEVSQTARMYVFLVAFAMLVGFLVFRWESDDRFVSWLAAVIATLIAIQLHRLAVFVAPIFLFPGLANKSRRQLVLGGLAMVLAAVGSEATGQLSHIDFPDEAERLEIDDQEMGHASPLVAFIESWGIATIVAMSGALLACIALLTVGVPRKRSTLPAIGLLAAGALACSMLQYHMGLVLLTAGSIAWCRSLPGHRSRLALLVCLLIAMAATQFLILHSSGRFPGRSIIGAFVGWPSIWPVLQFMSFSPGAVIIVVAAVGLAAVRLARGLKVPVHLLFFVLSVWAPLFAIGLFSWHPAVRYTIGPLGFCLLAAAAGLAYIAQTTGLDGGLRDRPLLRAVSAGLVLIAVVNPSQAWRTAQNDYDLYPDHKGAADFILKLGHENVPVVIAEDSIVQTYYLGHVNYRLQNIVGASSHGILKEGVLYDQYSGAPVIGSGDEFAQVLDKLAGQDVYVVSSAQVSENLMRRNRGNGISEILESGRLREVYVGRDGRTIVWKAGW